MRILSDKFTANFTQQNVDNSKNWPANNYRIQCQTLPKQTSIHFLGSPQLISNTGYTKLFYPKINFNHTINKDNSSPKNLGNNMEIDKTENPAKKELIADKEEDTMKKIISTMDYYIIPGKDQFQHIIRLLNTNIDGKDKVMYALTAIKGVGRRYSNIVCKKADVDISKRAGELSNDELERLVTIIQNPRQYKIPDWFLNRQKDIKDGKYSQVLANGLDNKKREDLETLMKIRCHRGLRHYWGIRVRGQHTKTTGRRGKVVGLSKKK